MPVNQDGVYEPSVLEEETERQRVTDIMHRAKTSDLRLVRAWYADALASEQDPKALWLVGFRGMLVHSEIVWRERHGYGPDRRRLTNFFTQYSCAHALTQIPKLAKEVERPEPKEKKAGENTTSSGLVIFVVAILFLILVGIGAVIREGMRGSADDTAALNQPK